MTNPKSQPHTLDLNRAFTQLPSMSTVTKRLEYRLKKSNEEEFTPLEITLIARHWEDTLASRGLTRNILATCASLFVEKDMKYMYMFVRARDTSEEALNFLYREIFDDGRIGLDVTISEWGPKHTEFFNRRRQMCLIASDQFHYFHERIRFINK